MKKTNWEKVEKDEGKGFSLLVFCCRWGNWNGDDGEVWLSADNQMFLNELPYLISIMIVFHWNVSFYCTKNVLFLIK